MTTIITSDLFEKWRKNDPAAYREAFARLFEELYARAWVVYGNRFGRDPQSAQQAAADAFYEAFDEIDALVKSNQLQWEGEQEFISWAWRRLFWRLLDVERQIRREWDRLISLFTPITDNEEGQVVLLLDILPSTSDPTSDTALQKYSLAFNYELLLAFRSHLTKAPLLLETLEAIIGYLKRELASSCGHRAQLDDIDFTSLLEKCSDLGAFWPTRKKMYSYLEEELRIPPSVLHQRMFDLRRALEKFLGEVRSGKKDPASD